MRNLLVVCLLVSLSANLYFLLSPTESTTSKNRQEAPVQGKETQNSTSQRQSSTGSASTFNLDYQGSAKNDDLQQQVERWFASKDYDLAEDAILRRLREDPTNNEFLLLEARLIEYTESVGSALVHYYALLDRDLSDAQFAWVREKIEDLALSNIQKLADLQAWNILATLIEPLWQFDPSNDLYIEQLATAYAKLNAAVAMENVLASLPPDDPRVAQIRNMLESRADTAASNELESDPVTSRDWSSLYEKTLQLSKRGEHFVVPLYSSNQRFNLLLDTGASTTVLSERAFTQLPSQLSRFIGRYQINTAGGQVEAPVYLVQRFYFAGYSIEDTAVVVLPMDDFSEVQGLLGMNILKQFDFKLDQSLGRLWLTPLP